MLMKTKQFITVFASIFLAVALIMACGKSKKEARLYFVEKYENGKEIGESEKFTPGFLTIMVDLRPEDKKMGTGKVELQFVKIKDADGKKISEEIINTVPFDVDPNWGYTYFTDHETIKFSEPGTYKVNMNKTDGTLIVSGPVEIVSK